MNDWITIDGREGEGGGQILRTSLSLAALLGRRLHITNIRAKRKKPGLLRQHLACVRASCEISGGAAEGAELGSTDLRFEPGPVRAGSYHFAVGSAGSTNLVLQTVLTPLLRAIGPSTVEVEGGTHNPMAPPFGFIADSFGPLLQKMGAGLEAELLKPGYFPAGGGHLRARITPGSAKLFTLDERGEAGRHACHISNAHLDEEITEREWRTIASGLHWDDTQLTIDRMPKSLSPGNTIDVRLRFAHVTQVHTAFGAPGVSGKRLASGLVRQTRRVLAGSAPVDRQLADQLMLPLAVQAGGVYRTGRLTLHSETNAEMINRFAPGTVTLGEGTSQGTLVEVRPIDPV